MPRLRFSPTRREHCVLLLCLMSFAAVLLCVEADQEIPQDIFPSPPVVPNSFRFVPGTDGDSDGVNPPPDWIRGHTYHASNSAPFARQLQKHPNGVKATAKLLSFFKGVEMRVSNISAKDRCLYRRDICCDLDYPSARLVAIRYGYGPLATAKPRFECMCGCITVLSHVDTSGYKEMIDDFADTVNSIALTASRSSEVSKNWTYAIGTNRFSYAASLQTCSMSRIVAYRVQGHWALEVQVTSDPMSKAMADWKRFYLSESIALRENGKLDGFPRWVLKYTPDGSPQKPVKTTTVWSAWSFRPAHLLFKNGLISTNLAVKSALERSLRLREQASDSTTLSNILNLMFPLVMALLPVALFADVSQHVAIGYAIVTDFMLAMPLFAKGIELVVFSRTQYFSTRTALYGMLGKKDFGVAMTWAAKCETKMSVGHLGAWFLSIASTSIIFGFALEIFAWKQLQRKKKVHSQFVERERQLETWRREWIEYSPEIELDCQLCPCSESRNEGANSRLNVGFADFSKGLLQNFFKRRRRG